jgi:hypothetical protein
MMRDYANSAEGKAEIARLQELSREWLATSDGKAELRKITRGMNLQYLCALPLMLAVWLIVVPFYLLILPFRLLPCCYARNLRADKGGMVVYTLFGGEQARYAWSEIEAFWLFNIKPGSFPGIHQWQLVLKNRQTIPLPLLRGDTVRAWCLEQGIPANYFDDAGQADTDLARQNRPMPGGRWLF